MIVKGKARSGPAQLAAYLLRTTDGERPALIYLESGDGDLKRALLAWDSIGALTHGVNTLYHAQIAPDAKYPMTREQWKRAAEILVEDLGMTGHPYAVILHEGGDKPHAHVVIMRTNTDRMTLWDDSFNYVRHELASRRMEVEFDQAPVPGKHGKRDRKKQPDFPRQTLTQAAAQEEQRTGLKGDDRKAEITALHAGADSAPAFKAALEAAGYRLARGDRGYVVVDPAGGHSVLARNIEGFRKADVDAYMAGIPLDTLPTIAEAKQFQKTRTIEPEPEPPAPPLKPPPEFTLERHQQAREAYETARAEATGGGQQAHPVDAVPQEVQQMHETAWAQAKKEVIERVLPELATFSQSPGLFVQIFAALHEIHARAIEHARELLEMFTHNRQTALATPPPPPAPKPKPKKKLEWFTPTDPDHTHKHHF